MMNSKNKARHILSETISNIQTEAQKHNLDLSYSIESLKGLFRYLRDMNPGTVITAGDGDNQVLYCPHSVNVFHVDKDPEYIEDRTVFWSSYMNVERIPGYQTKVGIMRREGTPSGWQTVIGWGDFENCPEKTIHLTDLKEGFVTVQALPLDSFDVGVRIATRRLSELNTDITPDPDPSEIILQP